MTEEDLQDSKTQETTDNDLHALAEGGVPQHGNRVQREEVVNKDVGNHPEVSNACAGFGSSVAGSTGGGTEIHCEQGRDAGPNDHCDDGDDQSGLAPKTTGEAVQNQGHRNLDQARGYVQGVLVRSIVLSSHHHHQSASAW